MSATVPTDLVQAIQLTAKEVGDANGIRYYTTLDDSEYLGFASLDRDARTIGDALRARGVPAGSTALVAVSPGLGWSRASLGALYGGLAFVPAPIAGYGTSAMVAEKAAGIARAAEASVLLTDRAALQALGGALPGVEVETFFVEDLLAEGDPQAWTPPALTADSMAFLLFTSGSTGDPKGVIATHGTILHTALVNREVFGSGPAATLVGWAPMHHIMGLLMQVLIPAVNGANAVVSPTELFQRRPISWLQLISRHRGTMTAGGNFAFALCTQLATDDQIAELDLSSMSAMFTASEPVRPDTVRAFVDRFAPAGMTLDVISPAMGMTESLTISAKFLDDPLVITRIDPAALEAGRLEESDAADSVEWVSCGRVPDDVTVVIIDPDTLQPVEDGIVGEIWVASPAVSPGYFRRPDATAETFGHTVDGYDGSFMRTGDLAAMRDGQLYVTGRLKEMLIVRGRNLYPQDLEAAARSVSPAAGMGAAFELAGHPSAVGLVLETDGDQLAAAGLDAAGLAELVRAEVSARFSLPSLAVALLPAGTLPRTPTGKVRRTPTRTLLEKGELAVLHASGFAAAPAPA